MKIKRLFKRVIATACAAAMVFTGLVSDMGAMTADAAAEHTLWIVGDSTVSAFTDSYYYPRYGYGTQIGNYLDGTYEVQNLAQSGTSSKSFTTNGNYATLTSGIKAGDTLIVGFGHNDEKAGEEDRYTSPIGDYQTEGSFAKSLYDNYITVAKNAGAEVILCTPIVRRTTGSWSDNQLHVANGGDYAKVIRDLGTEVNVPVVDLTTLTKTLYDELGVSETLYLHAWTSSKEASVDNTHLNIYGAKKVAWLFANAVKDTTATLGAHVNLAAGEPTKAADLVSNADYVEIEYDGNLTQSTLFDDYVVCGDGEDATGTEDGEDYVFKGTAFGCLGGTPSAKNYVSETDEDGNLRMQVLNDKGKITSSADGIFMYYYRVPVGAQFSISAKATLNALGTKNPNQIAFGLMARDDMYIDERIDTLATDYVVAGSFGDGCNCFYRKSGSLGGKAALTTETIATGKTYDLSIVSNTDGYTCTFGDEPAQSAGYDFALTSVDSDYLYIGMFVSRNADVTFSDIKLDVEKFYNVNVTAEGNGTVKADKKMAGEGHTVTVTATPAPGHYLAYWTRKEGQDFYFKKGMITMPAYDVELTAHFEPYPTSWNFRSGSEYLTDGVYVGNDVYTLDALKIDTTYCDPETGASAVFDTSERDDWAKVSKGTVITIPVAGPSEVTVSSQTAGVFTVDGQAATEATETFICRGTNEQVKLEFTADDYLGSISVKAYEGEIGGEEENPGEEEKPGDGNDPAIGTGDGTDKNTNDGDDKNTNDGDDKGTGDGNDKGYGEGLKVTLADPDKEYVYTGSAINPAIIVTYNGEELVAGVDYSVKYKNNVKHSEGVSANKKPTIIVTGKGNLAGSSSTTFEILKKNIEDADVYKGDIIVAKNSKATPVLIYKNKLLTAKEYKFDESKKKFTDDCVIKVSGNGNFTGTVDISVKVVDKADLKKISVAVDAKEKFTYDGTVKEPSITVTYKDKEGTVHTLDRDKDYKIFFNGSQVNAGTVKFTVVGIGEYTGTATKSYKIKPNAVKSGMSVSGVNEDGYEFNSKGVTIGDDLVVTYGDLELTEGKDYKITYSGNKKVGKAKYTIKFQGNYKGSKALKGDFTIYAAGLSDTTEGIKIVMPDQLYNGRPNLYKSKPIVDINGVTLKASNYTVEYYTDASLAPEYKVSKNNKVELKGDDTYTTVYVKIIGKGNYKPADANKTYATAEYKVYSKDAYTSLAKAKIEFYDEVKEKWTTKGSYAYDGTEQEPQIRVKLNGTEVPADQYEVSYTNNVNKGKATVVINGVGDEYAGSKTAKFSITAKTLKGLTNLWNALFN